MTNFIPYEYKPAKPKPKVSRKLNAADWVWAQDNWHAIGYKCDICFTEDGVYGKTYGDGVAIIYCSPCWQKTK